MAQIKGDGAIQLWAKAKEHEKEAAVLNAKNLSIVWGSDPRYWTRKQIPHPTSGEALEVAELVAVCWLQIDGKYMDMNLTKGKKYEVYFIVELKENLRINRPVILKLTRPNRVLEEQKVDLKQQPRNEWLGLKVGEFTGTGTNKYIRFSLNGSEGSRWKSGLTCIGAVIVPINDLHANLPII